MACKTLDIRQRTAIPEREKTNTVSCKIALAYGLGGRLHHGTGKEPQMQPGRLLQMSQWSRESREIKAARMHRDMDAS